MGGPVSAIIAEFCMECLEQEAVTLCRPKLWKRYFVDVPVIIKESVKQLTYHLIQTEPTGNIKFTHNLKTAVKFPSSNTLITRKPDGIRLSFSCRKRTHTNQC